MRIFAIIISIAIITTGCTITDRKNTPENTVQVNKIQLAPTIETPITTVLQSPEDFLNSKGLKVKGEPEKFTVQVPQNWDVKLGEFPEGLFWRLANEYSKDAGLDLVQLKGKTVVVWRYALAEGLRAADSQNNFDYPSNVVLLINSGKTAGAWLAFNFFSIGPSVNKRYLPDITSLPLDKWVARQGLFGDPGKNADLEAMGPTEVLTAFLKAADEGNKTRAYACLSPNEMLNSLIVNIAGKQLLYNPGFSENNSMVENLLMAKPDSYKLLDPQTIAEINDIGDRTTIEIEVRLRLKWRNNAFNTHNDDEAGINTRFAIMTKFANGWKISGFGTGP